MAMPSPTLPAVPTMTVAERLTDRIATIGARLDALSGPRSAVPTGGRDFAAALERADAVTSSASARALSPVADADWADQLPQRGRRWSSAIEQAADRAGIDPALLASVVEHESGFEPTAVSRAGATGLAQLMPDTADALGVDAADPEQNLAGGARYLRAQLDRFDELDLALAAYNAGPGRVAQAGGVPRIAETQAYVDAVTDTYREYR